MDWEKSRKKIIFLFNIYFLLWIYAIKLRSKRIIHPMHDLPNTDLIMFLCKRGNFKHSLLLLAHNNWFCVFKGII